MANPKLPVIYAHFAENGRLVQARTSPQRLSQSKLSVVAYPPPSESPPREYWRLLEPGETKALGDQMPSVSMWLSISDGSDLVGLPVLPYEVVRRRVSPPPKCETCPFGLHDGSIDDDERRCSTFSAVMRTSDYCSKHPQAQEANRG